jgi:hypothetical protein
MRGFVYKRALILGTKRVETVHVPSGAKPLLKIHINALATSKPVVPYMVVCFNGLPDSPLCRDVTKMAKTFNYNNNANVALTISAYLLDQ